MSISRAVILSGRAGTGLWPLLHATVPRSWGTCTVLESRPNFKIKRIGINPGASLLMQLHDRCSERCVAIKDGDIAWNPPESLSTSLKSNRGGCMYERRWHRALRRCLWKVQTLIEPAAPISRVGTFAKKVYGAV